MNVTGANEDNRICPFPNTRTLKCKNPFCGFTWAEEMDEVTLRVLGNLSECPMCHGKEYVVWNYNFKGVERCKKRN